VAERGAASDKRGSIAKIATIALAASSIEWYDFFLYGTAAALIFPAAFFPKGLSAAAALMASFSTFAVAFVARPFGAIVFGHFGDRHGRKRPLVAALVLMGASTCFIGCLPTYATIGVAAPVILVMLRFLQGFAIGGQWGGAVLLLTESAPANRRAYYSSFAQVGVPFGVVLANLVFLVFSANQSQQEFASWGWRIPFLLSFLLIGIAIYAQLTLEDSSIFLELNRARSGQAADRPSFPVITAIRRFPRQIALGAGAFVAIQIPFYLLTAWIVAYGTSPVGLHLSRNTMLVAVLIGAVAMIPVLPISAVLSDRHGRRGVYVAGAILSGVWGFVQFPIMETGSTFWITFAIVVGQVFVGMMYGPQGALFSEIFPMEVRYSGASLSYQSGAILGGGLAPLIATALLAKYGTTFAISIYVAVVCTITAASVTLLTKGLKAPIASLAATHDQATGNAPVRETGDDHGRE
jgi:MFS family permease